MIRRFPDGIEGNSFVQKEAPQFIPDWIQTVDIQHSEKSIHYMLANDIKSLLYIINLGAIEIHPFLSRYEHIDYPDYMVLDLDPEDMSFELVIEVALKIHRILDELEIDHYCKTSGKRGLHLYLPLHAKYSFESIDYFSKLLAQLLHDKMTDLTSLERNPKKRQKRVYIDYLQNGPTKTVICPYAVRALNEAPISSPLEWKELKKGLSPLDFTIKTFPARLKKKGDIFKNVLKKGIDIGACLRRLEKKLPLRK